MSPFPLSEIDDLLEELARVDRDIDRAGEGRIIDPEQRAAYLARLQKTRSEVLDAITRLGEAA